jgi:uncharacterized protein
MRVAVLGASPKPNRYANMAIKRLLKHDHAVIPINPAYSEIEGIPTIPDLDALVPGGADTITIYMNPARTKALGPALIRAGPSRVIFNPGTESDSLAAQLEAAGIEVVDACTLVMLDTDRF